MIYINLYLLIALGVSLFLIYQFNHMPPEIQKYLWEEETPEDIKEIYLQYPWMLPVSIIFLSLFWPVLIWDYIRIKKEIDNYGKFNGE